MVTDTFHAVDVDNDGFISREELRMFMINVVDFPSEAALDEMVSAADANNDGKIDFEGYCKMWLLLI